MHTNEMGLVTYCSVTNDEYVYEYDIKEKYMQLIQRHDILQAC